MADCTQLLSENHVKDVKFLDSGTVRFLNRKRTDCRFFAHP